MSNGWMASNMLLVAWFIVAVVGVAGVIVVLVWAVRSRQFSDQDRARRLPLDNAPAADNTSSSSTRKEQDHAAS